MNYLIVGLGNIGSEYASTRHNMGFMVLDAWAKASNAVFSTERYGDVAKVSFKGRHFTLLKPSTYMNLSGNAVRYWVQRLDIPLENLLVISDDLNLPFGTLRMKKNGSAGGHNGLENIEELLGTQDYCRIRIGIVTNNPEFSDIVSLEGVAPTKKKSVPIIALPTTAGTGAEVTINYVIIDEERQAKMVCVDPNDIPAVAIVDAELMYSLPKSLTAATGMDALTHAIEGYITKGAWVMSDMYELQAIKMIAEFLPLAVEEPTNPKGREGMALAQYIAAQAFSNVGLGLVHGMAHPMGSLHDIPHGVANALLLPTIMEFNMPKCVEKFGVIAQTMGVDTTGMSAQEAAQAAVDAVKALSIRVGIPQTLTALGIKEEDIPALAAQAIADVCTPGNPRDVTEAEIVELYKKVL